MNSTASAHELQTNTARVSLRDGNVVVYAEVDVVAWIDAIDSSSSQRGPLALSKVDPAELARRSAEARRQLTQDLRVEIDGERLALRVREFPSDDAIIRAATRDLVAQQLDDHTHRQRSRIVVEVMEPRPAPTQLRLTMPESLGEVLVNFVQPQTQLTPAGAPCQFTALQAGDTPERANDPTALDPERSATGDAKTTLAILGGLLGAFASGLLCGTLAWRRRRETP